MKYLARIMMVAVITMVCAGITYAGAKHEPTEEDLKKSYEHQTQGNIYDDEGKYDEAIAEYKEALKYNPDDTNTLFNLGIVYLKINKPNEAVKVFSRVVEIDDKDFEAYNLLGLAYRGLGKKEEAKKAWEKSLSIEPHQTMPHKFMEELKDL